MKSILVVSTPTSATGSLWRMVSALAKSAGYHCVKISEQYDLEGRIKELTSFQPNPEGFCYLYNTPHIWSGAIELDRLKVLINFRDPRDLVCNQFHWIFQHPMPGKTAAEIAEIHNRTRQNGIDQFAIDARTDGYFKAFRHDFEYFSRPRPDDNLVRLSYNQLCLDYDGVVLKLRSLIEGADYRACHDEIERERPEKLSANPVWIGKIWEGADISPGRHKRELKPDTISILTDRYLSLLNELQLLDDPQFSDYYL